MSKTILVTGSAGFIGFHVSRALLERGDTVIGIDNFNDYYEQSLKEDRNAILEQYPQYTLFRSDIRDKESIANNLKEKHIDSICHLAAQAGVRYSLEHPSAYMQSNIEGTVNLFEYARTHNIPDVVYASSSSVYGNNPVPWSEDQSVDTPINPYGASKRATELLAYTYHHLYGINMIGLRFFSVYGPWGRPDMAYFKWAKLITSGKPIDVYNEGKMKRDFTYIDDIVAGVLGAIDTPKQYELYNLGNAHSEELGRFISLIETYLGIDAEKNYMPMQKGDFLENYANTEKAQKDFGFEARTSIDEGLKHFVDWYKEYYNS